MGSVLIGEISGYMDIAPLDLEAGAYTRPLPSST
jgi:hypothetical protein